MTPVRTPAPPPPPPLPVRRQATAPRGGLAPLLGRLAADHATGVLVRERGTLYLRDGQVVHAESPAAPGLDVLLTARGSLAADGWEEAVSRAGARRTVGRYLVEHGRIGAGALELCHLGALYDAAYFVLGPSGTPAGFRTGAAHWFGPVRPVPVAAVERETRRRRELLHRIWPDPATDDAPLVRAERPAAPAVTARQRAVLDRLDGVRTAADIARALGRPTFHTLVDLRRLAAAGLVTTAPRPDTAALREEFDAAISAQAREALRAVSGSGRPRAPEGEPPAPEGTSETSGAAVLSPAAGDVTARQAGTTTLPAPPEQRPHTPTPDATGTAALSPAGTRPVTAAPQVGTATPPVPSGKGTAREQRPHTPTRNGTPTPDTSATTALSPTAAPPRRVSPATATEAAPAGPARRPPVPGGTPTPEAAPRASGTTPLSPAAGPVTAAPPRSTAALPATSGTADPLAATPRPPAVLPQRIAPTAPPEAAPATPGATAPVPAALLHAKSPAQARSALPATLPSRASGAVRAPSPTPAAPPARIADDPQVALLRRLRDALEAL